MLLEETDETKSHRIVLQGEFINMMHPIDDAVAPFLISRDEIHVVNASKCCSHTQPMPSIITFAGTLCRNGLISLD